MRKRMLLHSAKLPTAESASEQKTIFASLKDTGSIGNALVTLYLIEAITLLQWEGKLCLVLKKCAVDVQKNWCKILNETYILRFMHFI